MLVLGVMGDFFLPNHLNSQHKEQLTSHFYLPNLNPHFNFHSCVFVSSYGGGGPTSVRLYFYLASLLMTNIIFTKAIKFKFAQNLSHIYVVAANCLMAGAQKFIN